MMILTSKEVITQAAFGWNPQALIPIILIVISWIICIVVTIVEDLYFEPVFLIAIFITLVFGLFAFCVCVDSKPLAKANQYEVTFTDKTIPTSFFDEYKVVGQKDKIIIIQDEEWEIDDGNS